MPSSRQEGAAPLMGDHEMSSRLYAGNSEYPVVLVHVDMGSDNPSGADNQQETASAGSSETARQARRSNAMTDT